MEKLTRPLLAAITLASLTFGIGSNVRAQSANPCDSPNNLPSSFFDVPKGPPGSWSASVSPDPWQAKDPQLPVVVAGAGAIQGKASDRGMRLGCGLLRNRSLNPATAIQLRWVLARAQDRAAIVQQGYTSGTVLLEGNAQYVELSIPKENFRRTDFSVIRFVDITQPLMKEGVLSGDYVLYVGVNEVRFADGTMWRAAPLSQ